MLKKWLQRLGKVLLILLLLITGAWWFENWRGARAWEAAQERAKEAGFSLDLADYQPPPVPDEENLLKNPDFLLEWNGEIEPKLNRWSSANMSGVKKSARARSAPQQGWATDYRKFFEEELSLDQALERIDKITGDLQDRLDRLSTIILSHPVQDLGSYSVPTQETPFPTNKAPDFLRFASSLRDRAVLALHLKDPSTAIKDIECLQCFKESFGRGAMIQGLVGNALQLSIDQIVWEGIYLHGWDKNHLVELDSLLRSRDPFQDLETTAKFETIYGIHSIDHLDEMVASARDQWNGMWNLSGELGLKDRILVYFKTSGPNGWKDQRKAILVEGTLRFLAEYEDGQLSHRGPRKIDPEETNLDPFEYARQNQEYLRVFAGTLMEGQTRTRIARIAVAAEQHFLDQKSYPAGIDDLDLDFELTDTTDAKKRPLKYEIGPKGRPVISSPHNPRICWLFSPEEEGERSLKKKRGKSNK